MTKTLLLVFAIAGLAIASGKAYNFTLSQPAILGEMQLSPGDYKVEVNYYSARRGPFPEARGEVVVVLDEGRATEKKMTFPYRLFAEKQTVTVAKIHVGGGR